ncbi:MAG TPA: T9SS type A sorting domain-containing protein [Chitinophagaceae bacterium]|nr:T9SS type A sorting domain-containing protein [Chitinophagaceae bacterium]
MEKKFTFTAKAITYTLLSFVAFVLSGFLSATNAQLSCPNQTVIYKETFGTGTVATSSPDVVNLTYQDTGSLIGEARYRIINNTQQKPEWQNSPDHTGDVNGMMLVANGEAETFFIHEIDRPQGFDAGNYTATLYAMNVDTAGLCGVNALLTDMNFRVEYLDATNNWVPLTGSPYQAAPMSQTSPSSPTWVQLGSTFTLPFLSNFTVKSIRIILSDGTVGGCGNDFAVDDIQFAECPQGGQLPVNFLSIGARQQGSGVNVTWSTAQELNTSSFDVERSEDGINWEVASSIPAAGNSSVVRNYTVFDAHPVNGTNFYRIRETDIDGKTNYSKTVSVTVNFASTDVLVLENPFHSTLTIDFSSPTGQIVSARLIDITGRQVNMQKWTIAAGSSRQVLTGAGNLLPGIYILSISNQNGEVLYNNKVVKQ